MLRFLSFWKDIDEKNKVIIKAIGALISFLIAIFILILSISYMFSWDSDQSLLSDGFNQMINKDSVQNLGGGLGNKIGYYLVGRFFGLAAVVLVVFFLTLGFHFLGREKKYSTTRLLVLSFSATFILSWIFAFFSRLFNFENAFGGGLGGVCGSQIIKWTSNLLGSIITFILLIIILLSWMFFASDKFMDWFNSFGKKDFSLRRSKEHKDSVLDESLNSYSKSDNNYNQSSDNQSSDNQSSDNQSSDNQIDTTSNGQETESIVPLDNSTDKTNATLSPIENKQASATTIEHERNKEDILENQSKNSVQSNNSEDVSNVEAPPDIEMGKELLATVKKDLPHINVREELSDYKFPSLDLLSDYKNSVDTVSKEEIDGNKFKIRATLKTYKIDILNVQSIVGPTVTLYKVFPAPGVRISAIRNLQDDIAMSLNANGVRVVTLTDSVGIEVANDVSAIVALKAMLNDKSYRESKAELPVAIGYTITQNVKVFDLTDAPHLLIAGATKQGKSVGLNVLIASLLYSKHPSELKFVFIDPKKVEFTAYARLIKHYLAVLPTASSDIDEMNSAVAKDAKPADDILKSLCIEMDARYDLLSKGMVNNIKSYNEKYKKRLLLPTEGHKFLPYIVAVIDEYADLTMTTGISGDAKNVSRSINTSIIRLAQKGRAAGIHVVIATQRPSVDVITGIIKANFPTRIAFRVLSSIDSKTILDTTGAEKLIGRGDMMYFDGVNMERVQCAYISGDEINAVTKFIYEQQGYKKSYNTPYYLPAPQPDQSEYGTAMIDMQNLDNRFEEAARLVVSNQIASVSDLRRRLGMGFPKAGMVMDQLEAAGIVGPSEGSKPRKVLVADLNELDGILKAYMKK